MLCFTNYCYICINIKYKYKRTIYKSIAGDIVANDIVNWSTLCSK